MKLELQFLNDSGDRINEHDMIYDTEFVPVPNNGDSIFLEGKRYIVTSREFLYLSGGFAGEIRVLVYVKEPNKAKFEF
ncbi:hypothetical protein MHB43_01115 [Paenibacillus sp. FSL H8-0317]|uniref:hypothetical protein n=1 Tax=Paenibacillus sp. FSL H8-0317 TaxID=2921385 RepID=UPI0032438C17